MTANPLPKTMRLRLAELGRRVHRQRIVRGLCWLVLAIVLSAGVLIGLDALFGLPGSLRMALFIGWLGFVVYRVVAFVRGPLRQRMDAEGLAAAVEAEYPRLGERLTTVVELAGTSDPANGSPFLVDMLIRDAETRTCRLDLNRAAPVRGTLILSSACVLGLVTVIVPLLLAPHPGELTRRFFLPWYEPRSPVLYEIKVTSGDPTVKRGESTTLSALIEKVQPSAALPDGASIVLRSDQRIERIEMNFDPEKGEAYFTRTGLEADFDYQVVAGTAQSEWHHVSVVDSLRLEGAQITVLPPEYARYPGMNPIRIEGLSEVHALQHGTISVHLQFNRPASAAWFEWKPAADSTDPRAGADSKAAGRVGSSPSRTASKNVQERINVTLDENGSSTVNLPAFVGGEFRLYAEANRLKTAFREMPVRIQVDQPPRYERVVGLIPEPLKARPEEKADIACIVGDDVAVSKVELEYRVNEGAAKKIVLVGKGLGTSRVEVAHSLDLSRLGKQGDRIEYRLAAHDNREISSLGLHPQVSYFPRGERWATLQIDSSAAPLKEQQIVSQKHDVEKRLGVIAEALRAVKSQAGELRTSAVKQDALKFDQADRLEELRGRVEEAVESMDDLATDVMLWPELHALGRSIQEIGQNEGQGAAESLRGARRDEKAADRDRNFEAADILLQSVDRKITDLLRSNERVAEVRLARQRLENLAEKQDDLASKAGAAEPELGAIAEKQGEFEERLRELSRDSEPLREALRELEWQQFDAAAAEAQKLEHELRQLTQAMREADQKDRLARVKNLVDRQRELLRQAQELAARSSAAARSAPISPLQPEEIEKALEAIISGGPADAVAQQEKAAFELERLANQLEKAAAKARDPRQAALQLGRLQEDLRQRLAAVTAKTALANLPDEVRARYRLQQQALQKAVQKLSIPADAVEALTDRRQAADAAGEAVMAADAAAADQYMQKARDALMKLAASMPSQERRLTQARLEIVKIQKDQDAIASEVEKALRLLSKRGGGDEGARKEALARLAESARQQTKIVDALKKVDSPGLEERRDQVVEEAQLAARDLERGDEGDVEASVQATRREIERLEQAMAGLTPADEMVDRLAKKQKELAGAIKANAQKPEAAQTAELQRQQAELAGEIAKLNVPEAPATRDDALALTRKVVDAITSHEAGAEAANAAEALQRLADQVNRREDEIAKVDRLAKKQKKAADEIDRLAKKKANLGDWRKQAQMMLDEARHLRAGSAQREKQEAMEALSRVERENQPTQIGKALHDASESLQRLADKMQQQPKVGPPSAKKDVTEKLKGLPSVEQAAEARRLAEDQRKLRDDLAAVNEQEKMETNAHVLVPRPLEELIVRQEKIAQETETFAKVLLEKESPEAKRTSIAASSAQRATGHLRNGKIDGAIDEGRQTAENLNKSAAGGLAEGDDDAAKQLAKRQDELLKELLNLVKMPRAAHAQQTERQKQLQNELQQLVQKMQKIGEQTRELETAGKSNQSAARLQKAAEAMQAAREQLARNQREPARLSQEKAAEELEAVAKNRRDSGDNRESAQAGRSLREAESRMNQARLALGRAQPKEAQGDMRQAAEALVRASRQISRGNANGGGSGSAGGGKNSSPPTGGQSAGKDQKDGPSAEANRAKRSGWGELYGEINDEIISDLRARYGEEYASYIKLYFEQLAGRNK